MLLFMPHMWHCYPSGLEKNLCKWDAYVPLVMRGLSLYMKLTLALLWKGYRNTRSYGMPKVMGHDNHVPLAHTLWKQNMCTVTTKQNDLEVWIGLFKANVCENIFHGLAAWPTLLLPTHHVSCSFSYHCLTHIIDWINVLYLEPLSYKGMTKRRLVSLTTYLLWLSPSYVFSSTNIPPRVTSAAPKQHLQLYHVSSSFKLS
jgi:hypothetical protein